MKTFFILYWSMFLIGIWAIRSYAQYYRQHIMRHEYAERHRRRVDRAHAHQQMNLF